MIRIWLGVAFLSVVWLLGTSYYVPASPIACGVVIVMGVALLGRCIDRMPPRRELWAALVLVAPAVWYAPWPLRAAPLLILAGLALELLPAPRRWTKPAGRGAVTAGVVMLTQALTMALYASATARSHDLPGRGPEAMANWARCLGIDVAADGSNLVIHSMRQTHRLAATWDLLIDPATVCFFIGAAAVMGMAIWCRLSGERRWSAWISALRILAGLFVVWFPIRAGLLVAVYLHRVLRADPDTPLYVMDLFLSPWVHLLMLLGPVLLAWRFVRLPESGEDEEEMTPAAAPMSWRYPVTVGLAFAAAATFTMAVEFDPAGTPQEGRVMVVERHSTWEPTTKPYDTTWYGEESCYNYAAVHEYCGQYFQMSRLLETDRIDEKKLAECDVLVIKIPTAKDGLPQALDREHYARVPGRYTPAEVDAVLKFVENGGGLMLIGDHTNVFNCGTYLNDIARPMGFTFRHDLLYSATLTPYVQYYDKPRVPHPAIQHLPPMGLAVSNSIDPGSSSGRAVIQGSSLFSLPSEYHVSNYMPPRAFRAEMRYGPFIQLWSTRFGEGRVLAFTDSTIFSNFCTFQPGKAELMVGMLDWLNHRGSFDPRRWLAGLGLVLVAAGVWFARPLRDVWLTRVAAGACGWVIASVAVAAIHGGTMPVPERVRPMPQVVVDRTLSDVPLANGANIRGDGEGYGTFEQWIARMGCFTVRRSGPDALADDVDALVVICPSRSVTSAYRDRLVDYVAGGGKLLVIDSPENAASTAGSLLSPFGLAVDHANPIRGELLIADDWPGGVKVDRACRVTGGEPIARLKSAPIGAMVRHGEGTVMAVGFGSFFSDTGLGYTGGGDRSLWFIQPTADTLFTNYTYARYNVQFALLRAMLKDQPVSSFYSGHVVLDRTVSSVTLTEEDPNTRDDAGFKVFEEWGYFLGYRMTTGKDAAAFSGDVLVVLRPSGEVSDEFSKGLTDYVADGGRLLVVDAPDNTGSTANAVLKPFGLSIDREQPSDAGQRRLVVPREEMSSWPNTAVGATCRVAGGEAFAFWGEEPVGATVRHGQGTVIAVCLGEEERVQGPGLHSLEQPA